MDNTVLLFLSDNGGPMEGGGFNWPLRGKKSTLYEGGTRSFTIFSAPGLPQNSLGSTWPGKKNVSMGLVTLTSFEC
jgi:arylsulfatase A-like enzyme